MPKCKLCQKQAIARSLCGTHYAAAAREGTLENFKTLQRPTIIGAKETHKTGCRFCGGPVVGRRLCRNHYSMAYTAGILDQFELPTRSLEERFLEKITKRANGCWIWNGTCRQDGYAMLWHNGQSRRASRISYELYVGKLKPSDMICHTCDTPACVNPEHLFKGTRGDNNRDAAIKWRHHIGAEHHATKLQDSDVKAILKADPDIPHTELAKAYGVHPSTISRIRHKITRLKVGTSRKSVTHASKRR